MLVIDILVRVAVSDSNEGPGCDVDTLLDSDAWLGEAFESKRCRQRATGYFSDSCGPDLNTSANSKECASAAGTVAGSR
jgi:hypothetical protein